MSRRVLPLVVILLLIFGAAFLLFTRFGTESGPGPLGGTQDQPPRGEIVVAFPMEPGSFNPYSVEGNSPATRDLLRPVLPTLLEITPSLDYVPHLATRVPSTRDITQEPFSVTFRLRDDAVWSDGTPITSADVRFTWEVLKGGVGKLVRGAPYHRITDVQTPDAVTARLMFDAPYPFWRDLFSGGDFVLPKHVLEGKEFASEWKDSVPISGGPFGIEAYTPGLEVVYRANPSWWGRGPRAERVRVQFVTSTDIAVALFREGKIDVVATSTQPNMSRRLGDAGMKVDSRFGSSAWELGFNVSRKPINDPAVRTGIARALDRASIVEAFLKGEGRALDHVLPGNETADPVFGKHSFDLEGSKRALSGGDIGTLTFAAPEEGSLVGIVQRALQTNLRGSGVELDLVNLRGRDFYGSRLPSGNFDLAFWEVRGTPSDSLRERFHSSQIPPAGINHMRLTSPDLDAAVDRIEATLRVQRADQQGALALLADLLAVLPVFESKSTVAHRESITGPVANATVEGPLWNMETWLPAGR